MCDGYVTDVATLRHDKVSFATCGIRTLDLRLAKRDVLGVWGDIYTRHYLLKTQNYFYNKHLHYVAPFLFVYVFYILHCLALRIIILYLHYYDLSF